MTWPDKAIKWTREQIIADAAEAKAFFRHRRLGEPLDNYLKAFAVLEKANNRLLKDFPRLFADPLDPAFVAVIVKDEDLLTALRYLGAPPISKDDLTTLVGDTLAWTLIKRDIDRATAVRDTIRAILDPKRFPWIYEGREPTRKECDAAILASSVVASAQRVQTQRRSDEKANVEGAVLGLLIGLGFRQVPRADKGIKSLLRDAPKPGEFMKECLVGDDNADLVIGLPDHRVLVIECKGSNSEINSRKRINKEVAKDAVKWLQAFGANNIIPAAAIQGVFKPSYIFEVQEIPVVFFWGHRLTDLKTFIEKTGA